jgi:hypothetical protein
MWWKYIICWQQATGKSESWHVFGSILCPWELVSQLCEIGLVLTSTGNNEIKSLSNLNQSCRRKNCNLIYFLEPHLMKSHLTPCRESIQSYVIYLNILAEHKLCPAGLCNVEILRLVFGRYSFRISPGYRIYRLIFIFAICSVYTGDFLDITLVRLGHDRVFPDTFQFITHHAHQSPYC